MNQPIQNSHGPSRSEALASLLRRINQGMDPNELRREAHRLIVQVTPTDINEAEQDLIREGFSAKLAGKLSVAFLLMGILEGQGRNLRGRLRGNHILLRILAEHDLLRCWLGDLEEINLQIRSIEEMKDSSDWFMRLGHIVEHLNGWQEHLDREDDILFPFLQQYGWASLCRTATAEHEIIREAIGCMVRLIAGYRETALAEFRVNLHSLTTYIGPLIREHLAQEESVLYPIAAAVIEDEHAWKKVKELCDEIGYCGVHL